ncbi:MAG: hypothetical protein JXP34_01405 [Planctomycetes bacterium]|nr:hypothetical protein [Planctomycetota bacterium]
MSCLDRSFAPWVLVLAASRVWPAPTDATTGANATPAYSTDLGGSGSDRTAGDQVTDAAGNLHIAGNTTSADFPVTPGAFDTSFNSRDGRSDGFVMKLDPRGHPV